MNNVSLNIWGRTFLMDVHYQNYPGEKVTELQNNTVASLSTVIYSEALPGLKQFLRQNYSEELKEDEISNIFKFVRPKYCLILRDESKRLFALMCDFKFDIEHGLAVVFENERYKETGLQEIIL